MTALNTDTYDDFDELPEDTIATPVEQFTISSDSAAEWLLRKLANIDAERERVKANAAAIIAQLDSDEQRLRNMYQSQLEAYCRYRLNQTGNRRRSVKFLQGEVAFRSVSQSWRISNPVEALAYAKANLPECVSTITTEKLNAQDYTSLALEKLDRDGELLPGIDSTPAHESVKITFGK